MKNVCEVCGVEFESVKAAKTCSPRCRVTRSRKSVTHDPNVTLAEPSVTHDVTFEFYTITKGRTPLKGQAREADNKSGVRKAKYWYDVPKAAIPVIKKDWPQIPSYMDGRQYFLWWKNNWAGDAGAPVIFNPFKKG